MNSNKNYLDIKEILQKKSEVLNNKNLPYLFQIQLIGLKLQILYLLSKIKDNVEHVGLSQQLVH